ncbi:MAG: PA14 domain-containing protein [Marinisporobacter sp.]|nr:PA14 domain-containing protein [Marinisporobacter sp.]
MKRVLSFIMIFMLLITLTPDISNATSVDAKDEEYFVLEDSASKFVSSDGNGRLYEMTPNGTSRFVQNTGKTWFDIENYDGILYGVTYEGALYENIIDTNNRQVIKNLFTNRNSRVNSLVERNGIFYFVDNTYKKLMTYNYSTGQVATVINNLGYSSAGDLIFHNGELYLASLNGKLVKIDLKSKRTTEITKLPNNTFGLSSLNGEIYALYGNVAEKLDLENSTIHNRVIKNTYTIADNGYIYGTGKGMTVISGNVLSNDSANRIDLKDIQETAFNDKDFLKLSSDYGTLVIHKNGNFDYFLKNDLEEIQNLNDGQTIQDIFNYTTNFTGGNEDKANLIITIVGSSDDNKNEVLHLDTFDIDGNGLDSEKPTNDKIIHWNDSAEHNNVATNPGGFSYSSNLINGHPGIDMSEKSVGYEIATHEEINNQFFKEKSFLFVFKTGSDVSDTQVIYEQGGKDSGYNLIIANTNLYAMAYNTDKWSNPYAKINMGTLNPDTVYIAYMVHDSTNGKFSAYLNKGLGNVEKIGELNNVDAQHEHTSGIGVGYVKDKTVSPVNNAPLNSTSSFKGAFGEIISWNYALSTDEINGLNTNLNIKWKGEDRLPPNSPTINTANADNQITFTLTDNGDQDDGSYVSGIAKLQYKLGDGNWIDYTEGSTITALNQLGEITIYAKAIDLVGNESEMAEQYVSNLELPEITMKVRDATGNKDTYKITKENTNKQANKILNPSILLKGEAFADISVKGKDVNFFEYQFLNTSDIPQNLPVDGWKPIDLNGEIMNEDVITEKQGYLNQRSYDVNDGIGAGSGVSVSQANERYWSHSEKVFKNPVQGTMHKAASYSTTTSSYGGWENYLKSDGSTGRIWTTNSIFMDRTKNLYFGTDYREASKFWGYIKVNQTGDYKFGTYSDDGSRGYITANGETKDFVNMFGLQGTKFGTTNSVYHLEAGKYYPIHLEYFNWGGGASFELHYSKDGSSWTRIPQDWFYPSKNISPGEYATTIFTGSTGAKFPSDSGDYYIAFRTGKDGKVTREGLYGPFTVNGKTPINLSKAIVGINKDEVEQKNTFNLKYTITPSDIIPRSTFKDTNGNYPSQISIGNIKLQDEYPTSININNTDIHKIEKDFPSIVYHLTTKDGKQVYSAQSVSLTISLNPQDSGDYTLSAAGNSIVSFTDLNGAKVQEEFDPITITVMDKTAPTVTIDDPLMVDNKVNKEEETNVTITGTVEANVEVKIVIKDINGIEVERKVTADSNGNYTASGIDVIKLAEGDLKITATATDAAGNIADPVEKIIEKDTTPPDVTIDTVMDDNSIDSSEEDNVTISGTSEPNTAITIVITDNGDHTSTSEVTVDADGNYRVEGLDLSEFGENITITATGTDQAGNSATVTRSITKISNLDLQFKSGTYDAEDNIWGDSAFKKGRAEVKYQFTINKTVDDLNFKLNFNTLDIKKPISGVAKDQVQAILTSANIAKEGEDPIKISIVPETDANSFWIKATTEENGNPSPLMKGTYTVSFFIELNYPSADDTDRAFNVDIESFEIKKGNVINLVEPKRLKINVVELPKLL